MKPSPAHLLALPLIALIAGSLHGVEVDPNFSARIEGTVHALALDADGQIIAGGEFSAVNGTAINHMARLQANGELDSTFTPVFDGAVFALKVGADGTIYSGGAFNSPARNIARLTGSGQLDPALDLGSSTSARVTCLNVLPDGTAVFGGRFNTVNRAQSFYVGKLSSAGSFDPAFMPALQSASSIEAGIEAVAVQSDGKLIVGGNVTTANGFAYLVRLHPDGSLDSTFSSENGPILYPKKLIVLPDDRIVLAGVANSYGQGFVRVLNADGTLDSRFEAPVFDGSVETVALAGDGSMIVGGSFSAKLARLEPSGALDQNWTVPCDGPVKAIVFDDSGAVLIGGAFRSVGDQEHLGIARLFVTNRSGLLNATNENGRFVARLQAQAGEFYVIEASTDLRTWTVAGSARASTTRIEISDADASSRKHRFFRIRATR